ncbi:hypothetical protein BIW11_07721 [Tropilaelaps mercedesae]|uniref:Secreted protein n=1 Tax=Tropilaelaps mercedesae TaxID=418985 RepID=A0A1V9XST4_9ACAR|nr:hypothetical protein BIW11_07721 [Tropilaelaps mercedesae]
MMLNLQMASQFCFAFVALVSMQLCCTCMANVEQLAQVFETAIDVLAPPEKAAKLKADMEEARPCLETLVAKIGEETLDRVLREMVPLAMKCGAELVKVRNSTNDDKKKVFLECVKHQTGDFLDGLPDSEQEAFMQAKMCVQAIFTDME